MSRFVEPVEIGSYLAGKLNIVTRCIAHAALCLIRCYCGMSAEHKIHILVIDVFDKHGFDIFSVFNLVRYVQVKFIGIERITLLIPQKPVYHFRIRLFYNIEFVVATKSVQRHMILLAVNAILFVFLSCYKRKNGYVLSRPALFVTLPQKLFTRSLIEKALESASLIVYLYSKIFICNFTHTVLLLLYDF